jgi:hypothetical protein
MRRDLVPLLFSLAKTRQFASINLSETLFFSITIADGEEFYHGGKELGIGGQTFQIQEEIK